MMSLAITAAVVIGFVWLLVVFPSFRVTIAIIVAILAGLWALSAVLSARYEKQQQQSRPAE